MKEKGMLATAGWAGKGGDSDLSCIASGCTRSTSLVKDGLSINSLNWVLY